MCIFSKRHIGAKDHSDECQTLELLTLKLYVYILYKCKNVYIFFFNGNHLADSSTYNKGSYIHLIIMLCIKL